MILDKIKKPNDIHKIPLAEFPQLAEEIRSFLIESVSRTGGHLASNLGVVELTLALHNVLDFPDDKLIWDVGHQAYTHKILTGRKGEFETLRKEGGLSGFPKRGESNCDSFDAGHSSDSISAGLGYVYARDLLGENYHVVSVIGDGALTGGMAYEALNNAAELETNFIIVLNDNNMSISPNVGVMQYLETYHPGELVRKTDKEYCTKTHSSLVITPANGLFHWFSQSKGGNNALDYLVKVEGMDFVSAVRLLNEMTPMPVSVQTAKAAPVQQQTSRPIVLPPADRNAEVATAYLMHRGISPKVLRYCVGSGILYQTTRGSYRNCVFVGKDENGVPRSAFQRGCQGSYRGDVAGSQKQYGFLIPAEIETCDTVEIYEAPIDAMSGATLRQYKHDSPWRSVHYLALGGLNHQPIDYFLQQHPEAKRVSLCFDRDDPGRNFTKIVAKQLAERGYVVQDAPPAIGKDYNDYLLAARRLISMER